MTKTAKISWKRTKRLSLILQFKVSFFSGKLLTENPQKLNPEIKLRIDQLKYASHAKNIKVKQTKNSVCITLTLKFQVGSTWREALFQPHDHTNPPKISHNRVPKTQRRPKPSGFPKQKRRLDNRKKRTENLFLWRLLFLTGLKRKKRGVKVERDCAATAVCTGRKIGKKKNSKIIFLSLYSLRVSVEVGWFSVGRAVQWLPCYSEDWKNEILDIFIEFAKKKITKHKLVFFNYFNI